MTDSPADRPARLGTPGQVAAVVPLLTGFTPQESAVVISLKEPRGRVGLTMRFDLPWPGWAGDGSDEEDRHAGSAYVSRLVHDRATRAVIVVHTAEPDVGAELPRTALVQAFAERLSREGIRLMEALLVRDGRWFSYRCEDDCCPRAGTPLADSEQSAPIGRIAAERVWSGRRVLASRAELVASLGPVAPVSAAALALEQAEEEFSDEVFRGGPAAARHRTVELVRSALHPGAPLDPSGQARVIIGMQDVQARDEVATLGLDQPEELVVLLQGLCRASLADWDPPVCAALAWTAYLCGDGALANVALERALASDPDYSLALLLDSCLRGQLAPSELRAVLVRTAEQLRAVAYRRWPGAGSAAPDRSG